MAIGRSARFEERRPRVVHVFGDDHEMVAVVARVLELMEMAWHDCYSEVTPPEDVVDDVLLCSGGTLRGLVGAAHLAVLDRRDLALWAADVRRATGEPH